MKNKAGKIGGFVVGMAGFLIMFKIIFLPNIPPEDELAPGIVMFIALVNGFVFAVVGSYLQNWLKMKKSRSS